MNEISAALEERGRKARRAAWFSVAFMVLTVLLLIFAFFTYGTVFSSLFNIDVSGSRLLRVPSPEELTASPQESDEIKKLRLELGLRRAQIAKEEAQNLGVTATISYAAARVGAVLIGLFLVQILLGLTRYHFRLADHLFISAKAIEACSSDFRKLKSFMSVISTNHIDFGKAPSTPVEKILDVVREGIAHAKKG